MTTAISRWWYIKCNIYVYVCTVQLQRSDSNKIPSFDLYPHRQVDAIVTCLLGDRPGTPRKNYCINGTWNFENHLFAKEPHLRTLIFDINLSSWAEQNQSRRPETSKSDVLRSTISLFVFGEALLLGVRNDTDVRPLAPWPPSFLWLFLFDIRLEIKNIRPMACIFL